MEIKSMIDIIHILKSIGKAHVIILLIVIWSLIIEFSTGIKLFVDNYKWKKSIRNAEDASTRDSTFYLIVMISVFIYDIIKKNVDFNPLNIIIWIIIVSILVKVFYKIHNKYQAVDPKKANDDLT